MTTCEKCATEYHDNEFGVDLVKEFGFCYICMRQIKHSEVLREIAASLKSGKSYIFDGYATDVVPVGNVVYETQLYINEQGFGFGQVSDASDSNSEFFEWGSQLYIGPKSYNRFESLRLYREISRDLGIDDQSKRALEDMEDWQKEFELHFLAEQEIGFVVTAGSTKENTLDRWVSLHLGPKPDYSGDFLKTPYFGYWHVHELNDLFRNLLFHSWEDEDGNFIGMAAGVSEYLERKALVVESTEQNAYCDQISGFGYNEAAPLTKTLEAD